MNINIFKSLTLGMLVALTTTPILAKTNTSTGQKAHTLRLGKTAAYAGLTGIFGALTAMSTYSTTDYVMHRIQKEDPGYDVSSLVAARTPVIIVNGYLTLYFAKKTKEAYSAKVA